MNRSPKYIKYVKRVLNVVVYTEIYVQFLALHGVYVWLQIAKFSVRTPDARTSFTVEDLRTRHFYVFRISAENEAGTGEALVDKKPVRVQAAPSESTMSVLFKRTLYILFVFSIEG